jgi:hypothetical protein
MIAIDIGGRHEPWAAMWALLHTQISYFSELF